MKAKIKKDKPIELVYIVCLDVEVDIGEDRYWPDDRTYNKVLGFYRDINSADDVIGTFIQSEKYKALEKAADAVYIYRKAVPAFDFNSAYDIVDDVLNQIKELKDSKEEL